MTNSAEPAKSVLRWEGPEDERRSWGDVWKQVADELRAAPDQWGVVLEGNSTQCATLVQKIKKGEGPFAPAGAFEACSRTRGGRGEGRQVVYARYKEDNHETATPPTQKSGSNPGPRRKR